MLGMVARIPVGLERVSRQSFMLPVAQNGVLQNSMCFYLGEVVSLSESGRQYDPSADIVARRS